MITANKEEGLQRLRELFAQGWKDPLPCNSPECALLGVCVSRIVDANTREVINLSPCKELGDRIEAKEFEVEDELIEWPIFDKPLVPDDQTVGLAEIAAFLQEHETVVLCDDVMKLLVGFVVYQPDEGTSVVRRIQMAQLKKSVAPSATVSVSAQGSVILDRRKVLNSAHSWEKRRDELNVLGREANAIQCTASTA